MGTDYENLIILFQVVFGSALLALVVYAISTLKDLKVTLKKTNSLLDQTAETEEIAADILDDVHKITNTLSNPYTTVASLLGGLSSALSATRQLRAPKKTEEE